MIENYMKYMKHIPASAWSVFSFIYYSIYKITEGNIDLLFSDFFHVSAEQLLEWCNISRPNFFAQLKLLKRLKFLEVQRTSVNRYKLNHPDIVAIPDIVRVSDDIEEVFEKIMEHVNKYCKFIYSFDETHAKKIEFLKEHVNIENFLQWFINNKLQTGKIKNFNFGIFSCDVVIKEYKHSFHYSKFLRRQQKQKRTRKHKESGNVLRNELLVEMINDINNGNRLSTEENEVLKIAITEGLVWRPKKDYVLLLDFTNMSGIICKKHIEDITQSDCLTCFHKKYNKQYISRIECQLLNWNWTDLLDHLSHEKELNRLTENDKQILQYLKTIQILAYDQESDLYTFEQEQIGKTGMKYRSK